MKLAIVIPARMASTRFPGKPLVDLAGKPMLQWVYESCLASGLTKTVVVATPDAEIAVAARAFGAQAVMTRHDHCSGTDRLAETADSVDAEVFLNVQGDEPLIEPENLRRCAYAMGDREVEVASLWAEAKEEEIEEPAVVKVVTDLAGNALYFSRYPIPYERNPRVPPVRKHIGLYAYRRHALLRFTTWPVSALEATEGLEQLRFLENGVRIKMVEGVAGAAGVDTPQQAESVRALLAARKLD